MMFSRHMMPIALLLVAGCGAPTGETANVVANEATAPTGALADIELPGGRAFPESVAADDDGTLYVSNIAEGGVLRIRDGKAEPWIAPGAFGSGVTLGVMPDRKAGLLWLCSNDLSGAGLAKSADGKSALMGFDLASGEGKIRVGFPEGRVECNDMAVAADGSVYVTDTAQPRLFRLPPGGQALELFATDPRFDVKGGGLDGIAIGADGQLYVNLLGNGKLFRVEVADGKAGAITEIALDTPLGVADGMRHEGGNRFLVVTADGLARVTVDGDKGSVETLRSGLAGPTGVAIVGNDALVAEGQLSILFDPAKRDQAPSLPFVLRAVPLTRS